MYQREKTRRIIFHHSGTDGGTVDSFRRYHMAFHGWGDVGYHYVILRNGELQTGRYILKAGAHAGAKRNEDSVGVCLVGDFSKYEPTTEQLDAVILLVHDLSHIILAGWEHPLKIEFHRAWPDPCPGKRLDRADFKEIAMRGYL